MTAWMLKRSSVLIPPVISFISRWKGSLGMRRSLDFWNFLISLRATVPGLARGALFLLIVRCFKTAVFGASRLPTFLAGWLTDWKRGVSWWSPGPDPALVVLSEWSPNFGERNPSLTSCEFCLFGSQKVSWDWTGFPKRL